MFVYFHSATDQITVHIGASNLALYKKRSLSAENKDISTRRRDESRRDGILFYCHNGPAAVIFSL